MPSLKMYTLSIKQLASKKTENVADMKPRRISKSLCMFFRVILMKVFQSVLFIFLLKIPSYKVKTWLKNKNLLLKLTMFF
jgi:hypothetical protein